MVEADFSGYATKNGLKCSDGRTIMPGAFKHHDKQKVPLVWQHMHDSPDNILGHALLENRDDGVYAYGFFNDSALAQSSKIAVLHGDITALSIYANNLSERNKDVYHGDIREVSLVLAGANVGAFIDNVNIQHGDTVETLDTEAIIYTGLELEHADTSGGNVGTDTATKDDEKTVKDIFDSMTDEQKNVVYFMIGEALEEGTAEHGETPDAEDIAHSIDLEELSKFLGTQITPTISENVIKHFQEEQNNMHRNVFDKSLDAGDAARPHLSHSQLKTIVEDAEKMGSFKASFLAHAGEYGINDIDLLFPDAKTVTNDPQFIKRQTEWVAEVTGGAKHSPFSRIKTVLADITAEEARARGYVTGNLKKEEVLRLLKRVTTPTTVYKKQKLDRDDIIDITELDVIVWLKAEMRLMLMEELARAILIGDGRTFGDDDKINPDNIRPIATDDDIYAHKVTLAAGLGVESQIEALIRARSHYRGTGQPVFFTTLPALTDMLLYKDKVGRRVYNSITELAAALMVSRIIPVEVMEQEADLLGIMVNMSDYTIGTNRGGETSFFDDFDIDYNQLKYLLETRCSGALTKPKAAVVVRRILGTATTPAGPSFDGTTNTISIPTTTGVVYNIGGEPVSGDVVITEDTDVYATPADGYHFPAGTTTHWVYTFVAA